MPPSQSHLHTLFRSLLIPWALFVGLAYLPIDIRSSNNKNMGNQEGDIE